MPSKHYQKIKSKIDKSKVYDLDEAIDFIKKNYLSSFDETVEIHVRLGIDPKKSEQQVRGSVILPHGAPKKEKIAAFVEPANTNQAKEAGADLVGGDDLIEKIKTTGKCDFDIAIATPAMMKSLAQIARILGPKGLMPSPKTGSIVTNVNESIRELRKGKITFKNDESGNLHIGIAKLSWDKEKIKDNISLFLETLKKARPSGVKGNFIKNVVLATTMGPGLKIQI